MVKLRDPVGEYPVGKQSRFDLRMGNVPWQGGASAGGWRGKGRKAECVNQGDLLVEERRERRLGRARALRTSGGQESEKAPG